MMEIDKDTFNQKANFHGVMGLVFVGEEIIVYRRDNNTTRFPLQVDVLGGGREEGESPFETFQREVKEEVGLDIKDSYVVYAKKYSSIIDQNSSMFFIVVKSEELKKEDIAFGNEGLHYLVMKPWDFVNLEDGVGIQQGRTLEYLNSLN